MTDLSRARNKAFTRTVWTLSGFAVATAFFAGCSILDQDKASALPPPEVIDVSNVPNAAPVSLPLSRYGNPASYVVAGKRYYTMPSSKGYSETGIASWYGTESQGMRTSSGEVYDNYGMTAAHRTLPLPSFVKVTNKQNGRSVIVKINDRGPFHNNRLINLSYVAAVKLGMVGYGTGLVEVSSIDPDEYNNESGPVIRQADAGESGAVTGKKEVMAAVAEPASSAVVTTAATEADSSETEVVAMAAETSVAQADSSKIGWKFWQWRPSKPTTAAATPAETAADVAVATAETAPEANTPEVVAMAAETSSAQADSDKIGWKFWQWRPSKPTPAAAMPAETAANVAVAASETAADVAVAAAETAPVSSTPEVVAMAAETSSAQADSGKIGWKFWQWRPSKPTPAAAMPAETAADVTVAAAETTPEVVAMAAETSSVQADSGKIGWKFWQWRPSKPAPAAAMPAETAADVAVAAAETAPEASTPEVVAMATESAETMPERSTSRWKFWQWLPEKLVPGTRTSTQAASDTVTVAAATGTMITEVEPEETVSEQPVPAKVVRKTVAMPTTPSGSQGSQGNYQDSSLVYLQTGAFRLRENAERLRPDVEALAPGTFKVVQTTGTRQLYKIQIGPFSNTEDAARIARELKTVGINPSIMDSTAGGTMVASARTYSAQPVQAIERPVMRTREPVISRPVAQVSKPDVSQQVEPVKAPAHSQQVAQTTEPAITIPYTRAPVRTTPVVVAEVASPVPAPVKPARYGEKTLYQQAGAFARRNNAVRMRTRIVDETLEPTGILQEPTLLEKAGGMVTLHKVQVGPLANKREAMKIKRALEPLGITDSFPVYRQE